MKEKYNKKAENFPENFGFEKLENYYNRIKSEQIFQNLGLKIVFL